MVGFYEFVEDCTVVSEGESVVTAVYPNPTCDKVKIEAEDLRNIVIFNSLGEKVFESPASGNSFEFDFSHQASGTYLIKVETAKGVETKQVTVI